MKKTYLFFYTTLCLIILCTALSYIYSLNIVRLPQSGMLAPVFKNENGQTDPIRYRRFDHYERRQAVFEAHVSAERVREISGSDVALVLNRISAVWYRVLFNGVMIGHVGNLKNDRANIWNQVSVFTVNSDLVREDNTIRIEMCADYSLGGPENPVLLTTVEKAAVIKTWFDSILWYSILITQGGLLFTFVMFALASLVSPVAATKEYMLFAGGIVLIGIYLVEYLPFTAFFLPVFTLWKITQTSFYLAIVLINASLYLHFKNRITLVFSVTICVALVAVHLMFSDNILVFYDACNRLLILLNLNFVAWAYVGFIHYRQTDFAKSLLVSSLLILFCVCFEFYHILKDEKTVMQLTVMGVIVFCFNQFIMIAIEYIRTLERLDVSDRRAHRWYQQSITDRMTGLYNHEYVMGCLSSLTCDYSFVIMDIDNFKTINDRYGHQFGDHVIRHVADSLKASVRKEDLPGRYGGDEFCLVLKECSREKACEIAETIRSKVASFKGDSAVSDFLLSLSIGISGKSRDRNSHTDVIKAADEALYIVKKTGKNGIHAV